MKKPVFPFLLFLALAFTPAYALPPFAHSMQGIVRTIDADQHIVIVKRLAAEIPLEFVVIENRTRFRLNKKPATLAKLTPGSFVQLYYKREGGLLILTEVNWSNPEH
jgi:hypothetical protein